MLKVAEVLTGLVIWDEEEEAPLLRLDGDGTTLLHCGAIVAGELEGKRVRITVEQIDDEVLS